MGRLRLVTATTAGAGGNSGGVALLEAWLCHAEEWASTGTRAAAADERTQETKGNEEESQTLHDDILVVREEIRERVRFNRGGLLDLVRLPEHQPQLERVHR